MRRRFGICDAAFNPILLAAADDDRIQLAPVVVSPLRVEQSRFDLPAAANFIDAATTQVGRQGADISEALMPVPGTVAQNRDTFSHE